MVVVEDFGRLYLHCDVSCSNDVRQSVGVDAERRRSQLNSTSRDDIMINLWMSNACRTSLDY